MSLLIGIHINETLAASEAIVRKVGDRVFPIVAPAGVEDYPYIVYQSSTQPAETTKDGVLFDNVATSVTVVSKSYGEAVALAHDVRLALESRPDIEYERFEVYGVTYEGSSEMWLDDIAAYAVELSFSFLT